MTNCSPTGSLLASNCGAEGPADETSSMVLPFEGLARYARSGHGRIRPCGGSCRRGRRCHAPSGRDVDLDHFLEDDERHGPCSVDRSFVFFPIPQVARFGRRSPLARPARNAATVLAAGHAVGPKAGFTFSAGIHSFRSEGGSSESVRGASSTCPDTESRHTQPRAR